MTSKIYVIMGIIGFVIVAHYHYAYTMGQKIRIAVVSSYHNEYQWSKDTNDGFLTAMTELGYIDNKEQADKFTVLDHVESSKAIFKKYWMDAKRKKSKKEIMHATIDITNRLMEFKPDILLLGDDTAVEHIGNQFLDTDIPVVFWGVNNTPVKYGLLDNKYIPGHNVTGVYQSGFYEESINLLRKIIPSIKKAAILGDNSTSSRSHIKAIQKLIVEKEIPVEIIEITATRKFDVWKKKALELQNKADAFIITQYSALEDRNGKYVTPSEVAEWYLKNIRIPEVVNQKQFILDGMLCATDDSGFLQAYEAVYIANDILGQGARPAAYPSRAPKNGKNLVNTKRAKTLGIALNKNMGIDEYIN